MDGTTDEQVAAQIVPDKAGAVRDAAAHERRRGPRGRCCASLIPAEISLDALNRT